ncbi:hypothetical protein [Yoonia sp. SS1-5]|uniref:Uncharacterized protein n=1 Tax=Yoonia rhodophyticola TaxID=3137370 RepID=A0AAN0NLZ0_9RHOB
MYRQMVGCADDNKLVGAFNQMKAAPDHLGNHRLASDFPLDIADCPSNDTARHGGFCTKKLVKKGWISAGETGLAHLDLSHASRLDLTWFIKPYYQTRSIFRKT